MRQAKKLICVALAIHVVFGLGIALGEEAEAFSVEGEIIDMACYVSQEAKGPDHAGCAKRCVKAGQPMGLLTDDGTVYVLYASHKDGAAFEAAKEHAGTKVQISGKLSTMSGIKGIEVATVKTL
jgi:hypothetical protein